MRPRPISTLAIRALIASTLFAGLSGEVARGAEPPFGLEARVPWDGSRLAGSPEPPLPYTVEKTFTKQTWKAPIDVVDEPGTDRLWVIQVGADADKGYQIVRIKDDPSSGDSEVLLDVPNRLVYTVCFHPKYAENGYVYMFSNGPKDKEDRKNRVSRYTVGRQKPWKIDPKSELVVLEWKSAGHDGGGLTFGLDGMLYITAGDGTSDSDTWVSGQTLDDLLGSVLRINVDRREGSKPYSIPPDNPFLKTPGAFPEIWAYGLRNPWRMCTDPKNGNIWVGNNGQDLWETAYLIRRGDNYGWSVFEGSHPFYLERKRGPTPHTPPTIEHSHADFRSLTGGVVYRGSKYPDLDGAYLYGDYSSGRIWGMKHDGRKVLWHREVADTSILIAAFRVDQRGEILIVDNAGAIYQMIPRPKDKPAPPFPTLLSRTGLFSSTKDHRVERPLIPYSVNAPGWVDGLVAERFMAIPGDAKVGFNASSAFTFPEG
ncbi:PQQ-dependent sugar dehydrogenase, partial [Singulisphaera rosea]